MQPLASPTTVTYRCVSSHVNQEIPRTLLADLQTIAAERFQRQLNFQEFTGETGKSDIFIYLDLVPHRMRHILEENREKANRFIYIVPGTPQTKEKALGHWPNTHDITIPWDRILLLSIPFFADRIPLNGNQIEQDVNALIQGVTQ